MEEVVVAMVELLLTLALSDLFFAFWSCLRTEGGW